PVPRLPDPDPPGHDHRSAQLSAGESSKREIADAQLPFGESRKLPCPPAADGLAVPSTSRVELHAQDRAFTSLAVEADWDDPAWSGFAEAYPGHQRDDDTWRRIQLLYGLDRSGKLTPATRVLVAASKPDSAIAALSEYVGAVEVIDLDGA